MRKHSSSLSEWLADVIYHTSISSGLPRTTHAPITTSAYLVGGVNDERNLPEKGPYRPMCPENQYARAQCRCGTHQSKTLAPWPSPAIPSLTCTTTVSIVAPPLQWPPGLERPRDLNVAILKSKPGVKLTYFSLSLARIVMDENRSISK